MKRDGLPSPSFCLWWCSWLSAYLEKFGPEMYTGLNQFPLVCVIVLGALWRIEICQEIAPPYHCLITLLFIEKEKIYEGIFIYESKGNSRAPYIYKRFLGIYIYIYIYIYTHTDIWRCVSGCNIHFNLQNDAWTRRYKCFVLVIAVLTHLAYLYLLVLIIIIPHNDHYIRLMYQMNGPYSVSPWTKYAVGSYNTSDPNKGVSCCMSTQLKEAILYTFFRKEAKYILAYIITYIRKVIWCIRTWNFWSI